MQRPMLRLLVLVGIMMLCILALPDAPTSAENLLGPTQTIVAGQETPVPVGGNLAMVDRGAVLQATFGPVIMVLAGLVTVVGIAGFVVVRRR